MFYCYNYAATGWNGAKFDVWRFFFRRNKSNLKKSYLNNPTEQSTTCHQVAVRVARAIALWKGVRAQSLLGERREKPASSHLGLPQDPARWFSTIFTMITGQKRRSIWNVTTISND